MKKTLLFIGLFFAFALSGFAQKYALVDMEYILKNIPTYETANKQLEKTSETWKAEIDKMQKDIQGMYSKYQLDLPTLKAAEKTKRENAIVAKENELKQLSNKYFGADGEMLKRQQALLDPIQDAIYNAIKEIALNSGYKTVIDRASASSLIFASPDIDISNEVLAKLGYSK